MHIRLGSISRLALSSDFGSLTSITGSHTPSTIVTATILTNILRFELEHPALEAETATA